MKAEEKDLLAEEAMLKAEEHERAQNKVDYGFRLALEFRRRVDEDQHTHKAEG